MKKIYTAVEMTVILPGCEDILTASGISMSLFDPNSEDKGSFNDLFN